MDGMAYRHGWMAWRVGMGMAGMWWLGDPVASGGGRTATALHLAGDVAGHVEVAGLYARVAFHSGPGHVWPCAVPDLRPNTFIPLCRHSAAPR
jgi:hypothetical protein